MGEKLLDPPGRGGQGGDVAAGVLVVGDDDGDRGGDEPAAVADRDRDARRVGVQVAGATTTRTHDAQNRITGLSGAAAGGAGTVSPAGVYTAPAAGTGAVTVTASAGGVSGSALVQVGGSAPGSAAPTGAMAAAGATSWPSAWTGSIR